MTGYTIGASHEVDPMRCPSCGYRIEVASQVDVVILLDPSNPAPTPPVDGDPSICIACARISIYEREASSLRPPTADELAELCQWPNVQAAVNAIVKARVADDSWPKGRRP